MCGFLFIINRKTISSKEFVSSLNQIAHRGPDDEGYMVCEERDKEAKIFGRNNKEGQEHRAKGVWEQTYIPKQGIGELGERELGTGIFMGHRRLSIIDLDPSGHQPMSYLLGRYWIVFNGEIFNYKEIKQELVDAGLTFVSGSDTEVILGAYHLWGEECVKRFRGMWAFVIFDKQEHEVFGSRDNFGIKPMYYWISPDGTLVMGSEIKQFSTFRGWKAVVNEELALDYLEHAFLDHTEGTLFKGVYQIKPGYSFKIPLKSISKTGFSESSIKQSIYRWYYLNRKENVHNSDSYLADINRLFTESVKYHMISDVPVGCALSGGVDSSAVTVVSNSIIGESRKLKTFTSCSEFTSYDERKWAEAVNNRIHSEANYIYPTLNEVNENTRKLLWYQDEPYQSQSAMLGYFVYRRAQEEGVKVLLNGQGADEYMGGYGQWLLMYHKQEFYQSPRKFICKYIRKRKLGFLFKTLSNIVLDDLIFDYLGIWKKQAKLKVINYCSWNAERKHIINRFNFDLGNVKENMEFFLFHATLPKYLHWEDRNSMANSVEARVPFLDKPLVEYYYKMQDALLMDENGNKAIFREAMKRELPEEIYSRKDKKGFVTPEEQWVKHVDPDYFRMKLVWALNQLGNKINSRKMLAVFDQQLAGKRPFENLYWRIILFAEWMDLFEVEFEN